MNTFLEIQQHLLNDAKPSLFIEEFYRSEAALEMPYPMLGKLKKTKQSPTHHPEGSAWNHTMLVLDYAAHLREQSKSPRVYMWAALLHDIGKAETTRIRKGKITSYDHDKVGARLAQEFLGYFELEEEFVTDVCNLVRYHMNILFVVNNLPYQDVEGLKKHTDVDELALLGFADRMGRLNVDEKEVNEVIRKFKRKI
ncbi:MAG: HDIG domain-containing protein [Clostridium sp.]|nr:HDIG domain-containing protein [Clostridium sp.]